MESLFFIEKGHQYLYKNKEFTSVTTVVKQYEPIMKANYWSVRDYLREQGHDPKSYYARSINVPEDHFHLNGELLSPKQWKKWIPKAKHIRDNWSELGRIAREKGTFIHYYAEMLAWRKMIDIPDEYIEEAKSVQQFYKDYRPNPMLTEFVIGDPEHEIAGQFDLFTKYGVLIDYKSDEDVEKRPFGYFNYPLDDLPNSKINKYTLQLNLYKYIMEKHYGLIVRKMMIVNILKNEYKIIEIPDRQDLINKLLYDYKRVLINA